MANETIAAIATPPGRGGIGVVRLSGASLAQMWGALVAQEPKPRQAMRADFRDGAGILIDQGLALYFPHPHSYTGEDVIELQAHGGPIVLQLLLQRCLELGARVAEPGEFTKRAFLNDKIDLAQAEGVADLIDASTAAAARCAARSLQGDFSQRIDAMVQGLIELRTLVEATLDFPDEDIEFLEHVHADAKVEHLRQQLAQIGVASRAGSLLRGGIHVVIAGHPNVGKSSLFNRLAGDDVSIVTEIPGTTRDAIRQNVNINGVPLHLIDTAGLRESDDLIEKLGISKTWNHIAHADLVLWVSDAACPATRSDAGATRVPAGVPQIYAINKIDLTAMPPEERVTSIGTEIAISAQTGAGIELLQQAILKAAGWSANEEDTVFMARARHLQAIKGADCHLEIAAEHGQPLEVLAEELRLAQRELEAITGRYTADDLLGRIFSSFCIGK